VPWREAPVWEFSNFLSGFRFRSMSGRRGLITSDEGSDHHCYVFVIFLSKPGGRLPGAAARNADSEFNDAAVSPGAASA